MTLPAVFYLRRLRLLAPVLAGLACASGDKSEPIDSFAVEVEARAGVPFAQEGAVVTLEIPDSVAEGEPVPIKLRAANATSAPLDLYLRGREATFDITITDSGGDAVWRRLEGEVTQAILQLRTLAPGEVLEVSDSWDQRSQRGSQVPPGRYTVRGSFVTDGTTTLESQPATLEIRPR